SRRWRGRWRAARARRRRRRSWQLPPGDLHARALADLRGDLAAELLEPGATIPGDGAPPGPARGGCRGRGRLRCRGGAGARAAAQPGPGCRVEGRERLLEGALQLVTGERLVEVLEDAAGGPPGLVPRLGTGGEGREAGGVELLQGAGDRRGAAQGATELLVAGLECGGLEPLQQRQPLEDREVVHEGGALRGGGQAIADGDAALRGHLGERAAESAGVLPQCGRLLVHLPGESGEVRGSEVLRSFDPEDRPGAVTGGG